MRVKISTRTGSYAIYVDRGDDDELAERAVNVITRFTHAWVQEIYCGGFKKIVVLRHVAP
jgi:hypothetical protein